VDETAEDNDTATEEVTKSEPLELEVKINVDTEEAVQKVKDDLEGLPEQVLEQELSALKDALIKAPEEEDEEPVSKVHKMHDELGMAGSRNAFPIEKEAPRLGQRPGMMIGIPNRHHRSHLKKKGQKQQRPLGKGAVKIDEDRPVNN
jgi:prolyl-tRNA synthetase